MSNNLSPENAIRKILGTKPITSIQKSPLGMAQKPNPLLEQPKMQANLSEEAQGRIVQLEEAVRTLSKQLNALQRRFEIDSAFNELED